VSGRVQGVFFRVRTAEQARALGLRGWVRNLPDGRVEAVFDGPSGTVGSMIDWCRAGPPGARVSEVDVDPEPPSGGETDFRILH
jgi:acylphosphatase